MRPETLRSRDRPNQSDLRGEQLLHAAQPPQPHTRDTDGRLVGDLGFQVWGLKCRPWRRVHGNAYMPIVSCFGLLVRRASCVWGVYMHTQRLVLWVCTCIGLHAGGMNEGDAHKSSLCAHGDVHRLRMPKFRMEGRRAYQSQGVGREEQQG